MTLSDAPPLASSEPRRRVEIARMQMTRLVVEEQHPLLDVFRQLCDLAAEALQVERVGIWLLTADRKALQCTNLFERSKREHSQGVTFHVTEFPETLRELGLRRALAVEMAQSDPRVAELCEPYLIPLASLQSSTRRSSTKAKSSVLSAMSTLASRATGPRRLHPSSRRHSHVAHQTSTGDLDVAAGTRVGLPPRSPS